jgi:two-component system sensor histidine kinase DesK
MPDHPPIRVAHWSPMFRVVALVFAVYPLLALFSTTPDALQVALVIVMVAVFLGMVAVGGRLPADHPGRTRWAIVGALLLTAIASALSLRDPQAGWIAMFYYASSSAVVVMPASTARFLMVAAGVAGAATLYIGTGDPAASFVEGLSIAIIGLILLTATELRRANSQLEAAREELATLAVRDERNRIARDLHDILGHSLSVIALKSELARRLVPSDPERAATEIADVERVAREALASVRETVSGYRQPSLAIELAGARSALAAAGIEGRVEPPPDGLPPIVDALLAWAVREGVTNVVRHSRAERAEIRVERGLDVAMVEVVDDGAGSHADGASSVATSPAGSGLVGLRERVAWIGGRVEAAPLPGQGFRLVVTVPLDPS